MKDEALPLVFISPPFDGLKKSFKKYRKMSKERFTPQQIVDDFFHEYQEGRLDRNTMIVSILDFAKQYADERDAFREERELNKAEYTCYYCDENASCRCAFDDYNTDGDCLEVK